MVKKQFEAIALPVVPGKVSGDSIRTYQMMMRKKAAECQSVESAIVQWYRFEQRLFPIKVFSCIKVRSLLSYAVICALAGISLLSGCNHQGAASASAPTVIVLPYGDSTLIDTGTVPPATAPPTSVATRVSQSRSIEPIASPTLYPAIQTQLARATANAFGANESGLATTKAAGHHQVVWGDTLSGIAANYGTSVSALMALNELRNPDLLTIGQIIELPPPPQLYSPNVGILSDTRLVRTGGAEYFDIQAFMLSQPGLISQIGDTVNVRNADGSETEILLTSSQVVERVSLEFSVDARILLALLEYRAGLLSRNEPERAERNLPLMKLSGDESGEATGLYVQLSWLADRLNQGYYGWKHRNRKIIELSDGSRLWFHPELNAASVAVQYVMSLLSDSRSWHDDISDRGVLEVYRRYFGDPFVEAGEVVPRDLTQPQLTLPFPAGDVWLFTGGFHGGWGNGSAWAAIDFAPPKEPGAQRYCYTSSFPIIAVAGGTIARLDDGVLVLDLDLDGNEGTGWTILYLHISLVDSLEEGQLIEAGQILGFASCQGGYSTATHLHIARRYNGEWLPADCNHCEENANVPPFIMSNWQVVGLENQLYQGFMVNLASNRSVMAEQGRASPINEISW